MKTAEGGVKAAHFVMEAPGPKLKKPGALDYILNLF